MVGRPTQARARRARRVLVATCCGALLAAGGLLTVGGSAQASTAQLLVNPGFESGSLSGWSCSTADKVVTSPVAAGSYALSGTPIERLCGTNLQRVRAIRGRTDPNGVHAPRVGPHSECN